MRTNIIGTIAPLMIVLLIIAAIIENIGAILFVGIIVLIVVIALKNSMTDNIVEGSDANSNEIMKTDIDNVLNSLTPLFAV